MTVPWVINWLEETPSTQTLAREKHPLMHAAVFATDHQTAGYGRRGRDWIAPKGNLAFTLVYKPTRPDTAAWLGFAMGLAVYDSVQSFRPHARVALKWPNDLLINGAKCSGMLLEIVADCILVGVGINVAVAPATTQATIALKDLPGETITARALLERILQAFTVYATQGERDGFSALRDDWLARVAFLQTKIVARLADNSEKRGFFKDIDANGALLLETEQGIVTLTSADIYGF